MKGKGECGRGRAGKAEVPRVRGIPVVSRTENRETAGPGRERGLGWQGDTGRTGPRERKDSGRQEDERAGNPSREGSLEGPVQRARDAARLGVGAEKGDTGGKEGPGMQGMWPCRVEKGRGGKERSEGSGIRSHAGDAMYRERGRAGVREGKEVLGVREGRGIQPRRECREPVSGRRRNSEGSGSARMRAGAVPGSEGLLTDTPGVEAAPATAGSTWAQGRRAAAAPSHSTRGPGAEATRVLRGGRDRDRDPPQPGPSFPPFLRTFLSPPV